MKKLIAMLMALTMCASLAACGNPDNNKDNELDNTPGVNQQDPSDKDQNVGDNTDKENDKDNIGDVVDPSETDEPGEGESIGGEETDDPAEGDTPDQPSETDDPAEGGENAEGPAEGGGNEDETTTPSTGPSLGNILLQDFKDNAGTMTLEEMGNHLLANEAILFAGAAIPVEPGLLNGFANAEITGFENGVMFAPMIGSIPFVGYLFELADGADVAAFEQMLKDGANLNWNICVSADEMFVHTEGNTVFFLMSPLAIED